MHTCTSTDIINFLNAASNEQRWQSNDTLPMLNEQDWEEWLKSMYSPDLVLSDEQSTSMERTNYIMRAVFGVDLSRGRPAMSAVSMWHFVLSTHIRTLTGNSLCLDDVRSIIQSIPPLFNGLDYLPENVVCRLRRLNILGACYNVCPDCLPDHDVITHQPYYELDMAYCVKRGWLEADELPIRMMDREPEFSFAYPRITAEGIDEWERSALPVIDL